MTVVRKRFSTADPVPRPRRHVDGSRAARKRRRKGRNEARRAKARARVRKAA